MGNSSSANEEYRSVPPQKYNRCVSMTLFDSEEKKDTYEIIAMFQPMKSDKLYFVCLGKRSFGFCLTIDLIQYDLGRPSFEYELDYKDPAYALSFVTNGTLETFVEIMSTFVTGGDGITTVTNPISHAKNLLRINEWKILEPKKEYITKIEKFFQSRGVLNSEIELSLDIQEK